MSNWRQLGAALAEWWVVAVVGTPAVLILARFALNHSWDTSAHAAVYTLVLVLLVAVGSWLRGVSDARRRGDGE
jgi:uncharacterized membrane-anchored protein